MFNLNSCMLIADLTSADCAAWVQAVGTILAIAASTSLVYWQAHRETKKEKESRYKEHKARLETVFQLCSYSRQVTEKVLAEAQTHANIDESFLHGALGELDAILTALKKYEPKDFGDYEQLLPFMGALAETNTVRSACESARSICAIRSVSGQISVTFSDLAKSLKTSEDQLKALADKH